MPVNDPRIRVSPVHPLRMPFLRQVCRRELPLAALRAALAYS